MYAMPEPWELLAELMTAVDSHRLVNDRGSEYDEKLYATVRAIRRALA